MSEENKQINIDEVLSTDAAKEKVNLLIQEALNKQKADLEKDTEGLKNSKETILKEKKELETKFQELLFKSGNLDEIKRTTSEERDREWSGKFDDLKKENETLKNEVTTFKTTTKLSKLNEYAIKEIKDFNVHPASIEDAQDKFSKEFDINDAGELVHKANKINAAGQKYTAKDFYNDLQKSKPHWFNGVGGAGTVAANNVKIDENLTAEDIKNMSRAEYIAAKKAGKIKY